MGEKRDGDTKQLIAEAEALAGKGGADGKAQSTRELVSSAERLLNKEPAEAPKLSPVPLLVITLIVIVLGIVGIYSSYGTSMGGGSAPAPVADD